MVQLHVKRGDESQFLIEVPADTPVNDVITEVTIIYNGRLKAGRICMEMEELADHGPMLPPNIMGLTDEQVSELKLSDEWADKCVPSGGWTFNKDEIGRRNGRQPNEKMQEVLRKTIEEAKAIISKKQAQAGVPVTRNMVKEALDMLRGAVTIVYPMGLPPHDVIREEFENTEDLSGTQASLEVIEPSMACLWFCGKEMLRTKKLSDYFGRNDKTRGVVKLQKIGQGAPGREPVMTEAQQKEWMLHAYRKQEEIKVGQESSSSSNHVEAGNVSSVDSGFCKVEPNNVAPSLPLDEDRNEADSSDFVHRMLSSSSVSDGSTMRSIDSSSALSNITSFINESQYSIFNIHK
ncbi:cilia- and flagella-associated protein 298 [Thrips palmi]|uniref:Cilia- and flagella-associated protein 298 n=1 Tax=Thrips palmi TaxID=161013 RepID=A0A6P9A6K5_THRPL|nr:cilia- and flagella-associated protein 298 [Thrips palmi]XP_034253161.1 cilia- and flagella-associated protein 298 [Thrips palmi]XP_034253162.1 cilia- and flagella-associated protein 298 [Thrips palmi]